MVLVKVNRGTLFVDHAQFTMFSLVHLCSGNMVSSIEARRKQLVDGSLRLAKCMKFTTSGVS